MNKKYIGLVVIALIMLVIGLKVYKTSAPPSANFATLHNPNQDYRLLIEEAKKNKQPLFIEFYGDF